MEGRPRRALGPNWGVRTWSCSLGFGCHFFFFFLAVKPFKTELWWWALISKISGTWLLWSLQRTGHTKSCPSILPFNSWAPLRLGISSFFTDTMSYNDRETAKVRVAEAFQRHSLNWPAVVTGPHEENTSLLFLVPSTFELCIMCPTQKSLCLRTCPGLLRLPCCDDQFSPLHGSPRSNEANWHIFPK